MGREHAIKSGVHQEGRGGMMMHETRSDVKGEIETKRDRG